MAEEKSYVVIARISLDEKFKGRLTVQFTRDAIDQLTSSKYASINTDSIIKLLRGDQKTCIIWARRRSQK